MHSFNPNSSFTYAVPFCESLPYVVDTPQLTEYKIITATIQLKIRPNLLQ